MREVAIKGSKNHEWFCLITLFYFRNNAHSSILS